MGRWTPALLTGNAIVDAEHRELIGLIDRLELVGDGPDGDGAARRSTNSPTTSTFTSRWRRSS